MLIFKNTSTVLNLLEFWLHWVLYFSLTLLCNRCRGSEILRMQLQALRVVPEKKKKFRLFDVLFFHVSTFKLLTWVKVVRCLRLAGVGHVAVVGVCPEWLALMLPTDDNGSVFNFLNAPSDAEFNKTIKKKYYLICCYRSNS